MIGAGTVINPIIKIVTTVVILGAVYLFFVKPALDTTEDITDRAFESSGQFQRDLQQDIQDSFNSVPGNPAVPNFELPNSAKQAQKLGDCVSAAGTDIDEINRCMDKFSP
jgi:hypothetical protein